MVCHTSSCSWQSDIASIQTPVAGNTSDETMRYVTHDIIKQMKEGNILRNNVT
jgi:hypothetical protein